MFTNNFDLIMDYTFFFSWAENFPKVMYNIMIEICVENNADITMSSLLSEIG